MKKWCGLFFILMSAKNFALLSVEVSPNPVVIGQEVQLILKREDNVSGGLPDLSPLEKDFSIVGTQQSHAFQNINGRSHQEDSWLILMNPKHQGKLVIPALSWGKEKTNPISLDVQAMGKSQVSSSQMSESVFMRWEIEPLKPMIHEQVKIKLKIYHTEPLLDAKLIPPSVDDGLLFTLDSQPHLMEIVNQKRYQVEQYRYIVYPQNKGTLRIHPPVLDALEYGMIPTPIHQTLAEKMLTVTPNPIQEAIPTEHLSYQELLPLSSKIGVHAGDTIVRKVEVIAKGFPAQLIPNIQPSCGKDCKVFMNPPEVDNQMKQGQLYGHKVFEITYLPEKIGMANLEAIEIPWLNTLSRQAEILKIPAIPFETFKAKSQEGNSSTPISSSKSWGGSLFAFLLGGFLMGLGRYVPWKKVFQQIRTFELRYYALKRACLRSDAASARLALIKWARTQKFEAPIRDLHDIARQIPNGDLKFEMKALMAHLFSRRPDKTWQGSRLWRAFKLFKFPKNTIEKDHQAFHRLNP